MRFAVRVTANGAAGWSGCAAVCSARSALILVSHSSSSSGGRALSAGKEPMMPACMHADRRHGGRMARARTACTGTEHRCMHVHMRMLHVPQRVTRMPRACQAQAMHRPLHRPCTGHCTHLALRNHQIGVGDDEHRRGDDGSAQGGEELGGGGRGYASHADPGAHRKAAQPPRRPPHLRTDLSTRALMAPLGVSKPRRGGLYYLLTYSGR